MGLSTRWKVGHSSWNKDKIGIISEKRKKIHQYTIDNKFIKTWEYAKIAADELGCSISNISACARGVSKTAFGFKWSYEFK